MTKDERFRPYAMAFFALVFLRNALTTDYAPALWIAALFALIAAGSSGWFFRDVRAKQGKQ